jgi:hypothetical protein
MCIEIGAGAVDHPVNFIYALKNVMISSRILRRNAKRQRLSLPGTIQGRKFHLLITFPYLDSHPIHHVLIASLWISCVNMLE